MRRPPEGWSWDERANRLAQRVRECADRPKGGRGMSTDIERVRREVCDLHAALLRWGLVVWTSGNVSARVPGTDLIVIKPSGVEYDDLTPESMVVCTVDGKLVEGDRRPSSDTDAQDRKSTRLNSS